MRKKVGGRRIPGHTVEMKKKAQRPPTRSKLPVLRQLCHLIPPHLVAQLARDLGVRFFLRKPVDDQALLDAIMWVTQEDAA